MEHDLSSIAGFPLRLDEEDYQITTETPFAFRKVSRIGEYLKPVLLDPEEVSSDEELYHLFYIESASSGAMDLLKHYDLNFTLVFLPPRSIGREYIKTSGHYHPPIPGTNLDFPEVYTQFYGEFQLLLQRRATANLDRLEDCLVVEMTPGLTVTVPPGYGHAMVNTTNKPALMAGLYGRSFKPVPEPIRNRKGMAYYLLADDGGMRIEPNTNYLDLPELQNLTRLEGTHFQSIEADKPVWNSFLDHPEKYAFLTDKDAVEEKFL